MNLENDTETRINDEARPEADGYELSLTANMTKSDASIKHILQTVRCYGQVLVTHELSGPMNVHLTYKLSGDQTRTIAGYLNDAADLVEDYSRDKEESPFVVDEANCEDDHPFADNRIGAVVGSALDGMFKNTVAVDVESGQVLLFNESQVQIQPTLCQNLNTDDARELSDSFQKAADDLAAYVLTPETNNSTTD